MRPRCRKAQRSRLLFSSARAARHLDDAPCRYHFLYTPRSGRRQKMNSLCHTRLMRPNETRHYRPAYASSTGISEERSSSTFSRRDTPRLLLSGLSAISAMRHAIKHAVPILTWPMDAASRALDERPHLFPYFHERDDAGLLEAWSQCILRCGLDAGASRRRLRCFRCVLCLFSRRGRAVSKRLASQV